ncbi:MAG: hypothetical protein QNJ54_36235 [Prochloraceae cyanobacterium]|nr:hypothetical protein [Prochloraceae cyanobacterium]
MAVGRRSATRIAFLPSRSLVDCLDRLSILSRPAGSATRIAFLPDTIAFLPDTIAFLPPQSHQREIYTWN